MNSLSITLIFICFFLLAALVYAIYFLIKLSRTMRSSVQLQTLVEEKEKRIDELKEQHDQDQSVIHSQYSQNTHLKEEIAKMETSLEKEQQHFQEKLELVENAKAILQKEFENTALNVLNKQNKTFSENNQRQVEHFLKPFKEQITNFDKKISETYEKELKERTTLQAEIQNLKRLNDDILEKTADLTQALKGDVKKQGAWGELILERVLEISGLQNGKEYTTQIQYKNEQDQSFKPDVIIYLPDDRQVIIDAKVSLTAFENYSSSADEQFKTDSLKRHILSIRNHIKNLSEKNYYDLIGINSLSYTLLFIPIESAFLLAFNEDQELYRQAFEKNIIVVTPSTLLAVLKTIKNLWQFDDANKNAQEIAKKAGDLYDKMHGFLDSFQSIGNQLHRTKKTYDEAMNKLQSGQGNVIKRLEDIKKLGARSKKQITMQETITEEFEEL